MNETTQSDHVDDAALRRVMNDANKHLFDDFASEATVIFQFAASLVPIAGMQRRDLAFSTKFGTTRRQPDLVVGLPPHPAKLILEAKATKIYAYEDLTKINDRWHPKHVLAVCLDLLRLAAFDAPEAKRLFLYRDAGQITRRFRGQEEPEKWGFLQNMLPLMSLQQDETLVASADVMREIMCGKLPSLDPSLRSRDSKNDPEPRNLSIRAISIIEHDWDNVFALFQIETPDVGDPN